MIDKKCRAVLREHVKLTDRELVLSVERAVRELHDRVAATPRAESAEGAPGARRTAVELGADAESSFTRLLVHTIAKCYGLRSHTVHGEAGCARVIVYHEPPLEPLVPRSEALHEVQRIIGVAC